MGGYTPDGAGKAESGQWLSFAQHIFAKPYGVSQYQYNLFYPAESGATVPMKQQ